MKKVIKKYIKNNIDVLNLINNKKYHIIEIKPIKRYDKKNIMKPYISTYCVIYEKLI